MGKVILKVTKVMEKVTKVMEKVTKSHRMDGDARCKEAFIRQYLLPIVTRRDHHRQDHAPVRQRAEHSLQDSLRLLFRCNHTTNTLETLPKFKVQADCLHSYPCPDRRGTDGQRPSRLSQSSARTRERMRPGQSCRTCRSGASPGENMMKGKVKPRTGKKRQGKVRETQGEFKQTRVKSHLAVADDELRL